MLVILGLLVGGILSGQSLIRASELRSIIRQRDGYVTAVQSFRDKYFSFPGDMPNATQFWGVAAGATGNDNTCSVAVSTNVATCNGNGDGQVLSIAGGVAESFRFWQHLANAGLIEGRFSGAAGMESNTTNVPSGKIGNTLWYITNYGKIDLNASTSLFDGQYDHILLFGGYIPFSGIPGNQILTTQEVWNIDTKIDDGKPAQGKVVVYAGQDYELSDITSAADGDGNPATTTYKLDFPDRACAIIFRQQF